MIVRLSVWRARRCERGLVAGAEALAIGSLVMIAGMVLVVNAWAVIDTRMALDSAAREYLRTYTEADDRTIAQQEALDAARGVLGNRPAEIVDHTAAFGPCAPARVQIRSHVPAIRIPFVTAQWGTHTVTADAVELIDAHREMEPESHYDATRTACNE